MSEPGRSPASNLASGGLKSLELQKSVQSTVADTAKYWRFLRGGG